MFEILTVTLCFLLVFIVLPILVVIKAARWLFEPVIDEVGAVNEVRAHNWRNADAVEREKMVRKSCDRAFASGSSCSDMKNGDIVIPFPCTR